MDLELSGAHKGIRERARAVAQAEILPLAAYADRTASFPLSQMAALAREGFLAMLVRREHGGTGDGSVAYSLAMTEIARACASTAVTMAVTNMVADAISAWGDEAQQKKYIPELANGALVAGAFALSEPNAGSDAGSLKTRAVKRGDHYVLSGGKCWITSGDRAGVILVMAKTDPDARSNGISTFLVEPTMRGFSVGKHEEKMGLRASSTVSLAFDELEVHESQRLGPEGIGFKVAMRALDGGRIGIGSHALGLGLAALEPARAHAAADPARAQDQSIQWKLADTATELDASRLLVLRAAALKDAGAPFSSEASMAKLYATEAAKRAVSRALEILAAHGLRAVEDELHATEPAKSPALGGAWAPGPEVVERLFRDVQVETIYEGTSEVQRLVIARHLLATFAPPARG